MLVPNCGHAADARRVVFDREECVVCCALYAASLRAWEASRRIRRRCAPGWKVRQDTGSGAAQRAAAEAAAALAELREWMRENQS